MKFGELVQTAVLGAVATVFVATNFGRPERTLDNQPFRARPVVVWSEPVLSPVIVRAVRPEVSRVRDIARRTLEAVRYTSWSRPPAGVRERARGGRAVAVTLTQYCLQGTTRRDNWVREGIVAADPGFFPLARYVEIFVGKRYLGRYLVDDTGLKVKGATLDIWNPNCREARRFGRQWGTAQLVVNPER